MEAFTAYRSRQLQAPRSGLIDLTTVESSLRGDIITEPIENESMDVENGVLEDLILVK